MRAAYETLAGLQRRGQVRDLHHFWQCRGELSDNGLIALSMALGWTLCGARKTPISCDTIGLPADKVLVAGVVDGRNIWRTDLGATLDRLDDLTTIVPAERLIIAPSCSLLHVPYDARRETEIDPEVRTWLAFAEQKLDEVVILGRGMYEGRDAVATELAANGVVVHDRATSIAYP